MIKIDKRNQCHCSNYCLQAYLQLQYSSSNIDNRIKRQRNNQFCYAKTMIKKWLWYCTVLESWSKSYWVERKGGDFSNFSLICLRDLQCLEWLRQKMTGLGYLFMNSRKMSEKSRNVFVRTWNAWITYLDLA